MYINFVYLYFLSGKHHPYHFVSLLSLDSAWVSTFSAQHKASPYHIRKHVKWVFKCAALDKSKTSKHKHLHILFCSLLLWHYIYCRGLSDGHNIAQANASYVHSQKWVVFSILESATPNCDAFASWFRTHKSWHQVRHFARYNYVCVCQCMCAVHMWMYLRPRMICTSSKVFDLLAALSVALLKMFQCIQLRIRNNKIKHQNTNTCLCWLCLAHSKFAK